MKILWRRQQFLQDDDYVGYIIAVASIDDNLSISSFSKLL